jgi:hypothetical protein
MWRLYKTGYWNDNWIYWITHSYTFTTEFLTITTDSHNWVTSPAESLQGPGPPADPTGSHWPSTNSSIFWRLALCNSLNRTGGVLKVKVTLWPTASLSVRLLQLAYIAWPAHCWLTWCLPRARPPFCLRHVRHIVYVTPYCCLVAIATVVHKLHIAYSMHVTILTDTVGPPCLLIQYPRFAAARKKIGKLKK